MKTLQELTDTLVPTESGIFLNYQHGIEISEKIAANDEGDISSEISLDSTSST